ncbi:MAG TPA: flagellar biosynthetic protein FliR [Oligoflexia bacterium]|nr:flagellar biosynthetic protein FliR [Oligoflexia bacterium]HMP49689.1 flagellar biosynthetic protein FliR [Oligoflexia bacterium]
MGEWALIVFFLLFIRHSIILFLITPLRGVLGSSGIIIVSLGISFFIFPEQLIIPTVSESKDFFSLCIRQVGIALLIGIPISLVLEIVPFTGRLIDTFRGAQFSEQLAPEMGPRDSQLESYGGLFVLWIFFEGQYAGRIIEILIKAMDTFPVISDLSVSSTKPGSLNPDSLMIWHVDLARFGEFLSSFFSICIIIVLPLIIFSLALELSLSVLQKLCSRFHVGVELTLLRAVLGVVFLLILIRGASNGAYMCHQLVLMGYDFLDFVVAGRGRI